MLLRWCALFQYFCLRDLQTLITHHGMSNDSAGRALADTWTDGTDSVHSTADAGGEKDYAVFPIFSVQGCCACSQCWEVGKVGHT